MTGLERISAAFTACQSQERAALMPYFTLGYPNRDTSMDIIREIARAGADMIELGWPFSDPLADGPTIQHSTQVALENGITTSDCLQMVRELRECGITQPFLIMGYYNPILAFGAERFVTEAHRAGADGLIVPDLPVEEAEALEAACHRLGMALVFLVAPTTPESRLAYIAAHSTGFIYIVSLTGVTGAREQVAEGLEAFLARVQRVTDKPLAVGFGISTPAQAAQVGRLANGVIVGSALIEAVGKAKDPAQASGAFVGTLFEALQNNMGVPK